MNSHTLFNKKPVDRVKGEVHPVQDTNKIKHYTGKKTGITFVNISKKELKYDARFDFIANKHDYHILGEGSFSVTYKGQYKNKPVAIKHAKLYEASEHSSQLDIFKQECTIYKKIAEAHCANPRDISYHRVIKCYGKNTKEAFLVLEFASYGDLDTLSTKGKKLTWNQAYRVVGDVVTGLTFLHKFNIVHGDIKPANVLLDKKKRGKLTDFGLSKVEDNVIEKVGSPLYMDPQQLSTRFVDAFKIAEPRKRKLDIWGVGLLLFSLFEEKTPYEQAESIEDLYQTVVVNKEINVIPPLNHRTIAAKKEYDNALFHLQIADASQDELDVHRQPIVTDEKKQEIEKGIILAQDQTKKVNELITWCCQYSRASRPTANKLLSQLKKPSHIPLSHKIMLK